MRKAIKTLLLASVIPILFFVGTKLADNFADANQQIICSIEQHQLENLVSVRTQISNRSENAIDSLIVDLNSWKPIFVSYNPEKKEGENRIVKNILVEESFSFIVVFDNKDKANIVEKLKESITCKIKDPKTHVWDTVSIINDRGFKQIFKSQWFWQFLPLGILVVICLILLIFIKSDDD